MRISNASSSEHVSINMFAQEATLAVAPGIDPKLKISIYFAAEAAKSER
jgi:hypothetical protein